MLKEKPFLEFGITIENFLGLQSKLMKVFCLLSLLACIQMSIFGAFNANAFSEDGWMFANVSFAAFSGARAKCLRSPVMNDNAHAVKLFALCPEK